MQEPAEVHKRRRQLPQQEAGTCMAAANMTQWLPVCLTLLEGGCSSASRS
jgi:hypothetical protein